jgi:UDP-N-acetylglucosamine--N-acetylmuramyl-(pentapeptide) pyrophosphoryl-undecaprenol N-acetylglucosamine transferase
MKINKIIVAGGGTSGHVNAGISIVEEFKKEFKAVDILFIGTKRGKESKIIPKKNYKISYINSRGLKRENIFIFIYALFLIPVSIIQSLIKLLKFRPQLVFGVGGFSAGPVCLAARILKIPVYILEQNIVLGLTNKLISKFASATFTAFPMENKNFIFTGNPVRDEIKKVNYKTSLDKFKIFIFGGSLGARAINNTIIKAIPLLNKIKDIEIVHQTGSLDYEKVKNAYKKAKFKHKVYDYTYDIYKEYKDLDLLICRSGASSVFEIIASCVPSILIPLPTAADNHQYYNAKFLHDIGASDILKQEFLTKDVLLSKITYYMNNKIKLYDMVDKLKLLRSKEKAQTKIVKYIKRHILND